MYGINGDHGFIPLGKYSSARDSILHFLCMSEWANDSNGNSEAPTGYYWRISNTPEDVSINNGEFNSVIEDWFTDNPEVTDSGFLRAELVGHFIVSTNDQGFVMVASGYESEERLIQAYITLEDEFAAWDEQGED